MGLGSQAGTPHTPSHQCGSEGYCVGSGDLLIQGLFSTSMYAMPGINRHTHTYVYVDVDVYFMYVYVHIYIYMYLCI